ncbi:protein KRI1 homolog [Anopheles cruzii]|uniref:protein KRI1 homolog n=1 Tax=Anopheles cruzii TaxID=68878 RepID=UPI0022EC3A8D|nr:protein KRI1 homolog [Anopheles cruzii]
MSNKKKLFNDSDPEEEEESVEFRTNKSYAKHYDEFRKKEILGQLKNLESDGSDSSDDETTDDEIVDADFDKEFFRTLAFLKRNDPSKYTEEQSFFKNVKPVEEVALAKRHRKEKPMTLKDYERKVMLEKDGVYEDEEDLGHAPHAATRPESPSLVEQQKRIKDEIKQALSAVTDSDDESEGGLLKERVRSKAEHEKEQADYRRWLADRKANEEPPNEEVKALQPLKHFWTSEKLSKEDAFLKDYILNNRFVQSGDIPNYDDIVATSEDEAELEKQEEYERQYNFRFEEPDPEFIKRYPRTVDDTLRVERNKRQEQRQALKERKQKEREQQRRDLDELKAVKLKEIRDRIQRLKEIAATEKLAMNEDDLESDFDPDEHDRRMREMFNDDYYGVDEGDQKPEFPQLDEELGIENYDKDELEAGADGERGLHCEDDDFVMDCDYEEEKQNKSAKDGKEALQQELMDSTRSRKKKGRRQSKFREMLRAEKPLFDPEDEKTYGEYIDEYYKLDYEDIIGDTPCRFRYVETTPNDFGLTVEEILAANPRELNHWASVKKTVQLRPKNVELREIDLYRRKASNEWTKRRILPSLYAEPAENEDEDKELTVRKQLSDSETTQTASDKQSKKTAPNVNLKQLQKKGINVKVKESQPKEFTKKKKKGKTDKTSEPLIPPFKDKPIDVTAKKKKHKDKSNPALSEENPQEKIPAVSANGEAMAPNVSSMNDQGHKRKQKNKHKKALIGDEDTSQIASLTSADGFTHQKKRTWHQRDQSSPKGPSPDNLVGTKKSRVDQHPHRGNRKSAQGAFVPGKKRPTTQQPESASDQRLRAFGLNPRKFHNSQKYGNRAQNGNISNAGNKNGRSFNKSFEKKGKKSVE